MQYQSQSVAKLYFIAAIGLFLGQILFGVIIGAQLLSTASLLAVMKKK